ncbi:MAG: flagellar hook capping FlgD N-terminal domain-containing protein [Verrucomicrobiota bacterium]
MSTIAGIDATAAATAADTASRLTEQTMTQTDFLKVMVAQMANQNPLKPNDANEYYKNLMEMSNYQSTLAMDQNLTNVYTMQQQLLAQSLVGETVEVTNDEGVTTTGVVESAYVKDSNVVVTVDGNDYATTTINRILQPQQQS